MVINLKESGASSFLFPYHAHIRNPKTREHVFIYRFQRRGTNTLFSSSSSSSSSSSMTQMSMNTKQEQEREVVPPLPSDSEVVVVIKEAKAGKEPAVVGIAEGDQKQNQHQEQLHPYDFHASGPRNLSSPNWRDLFWSSWKDANYKRMVIACFIQAVYLLELDRQENKTEEAGLSAKWWKPFKYKLVEKLVDERDGSIYGAILEWDRSAAMSEFILMRPSGAPRAVLALRGTLLKSMTIRRDLEDDLRFLTWESLKGSVRFRGAMEGLKSAVERYGSSNVCVGGHSLGAGLALQVGKEMAKQGVFVECHLFNPPSVSLAMSLRSIAEKATSAWKRVRAVFPSNEAEDSSAETVVKKEEIWKGMKKFVPHLYVNNSDYICCHYTSSSRTSDDHDSNNSDAAAKATGGGGGGGGLDAVGAKLFVMSKGPQKFLEAHGLQQWWSDDMELQMALHSKLINRQLSSLYTSAAASSTPKVQ